VTAVARGGDEREWEELAAADPLWAVATRPGTRGGGWDRAEFFAGGERAAAKVMARAQRLGMPRSRRRALDFGCGVGRNTRGLAAHFEECLGVDVSAEMVARARELNADRPGCRFERSAPTGLPDLADGAFDLVYSRLVLQHVAPATVRSVWLPELARVLAPGGLLCVQLPCAIPRRHRLALRRRGYRAARALRLPARVALRLRLNPMRMTALPDAEVRAILAAAGLRVLDVETRRAPSGVVGATYLATRQAGIEAAAR